MKKQKELRKGLLFSLLILVFLGGTALTTYGASLGDVNNSGVIDIVDALMIAQYVVGLNPSGFNSAVADTNADGSVNIIDALVVAQYVVGLITTLPPGGTITPTATPIITATRTATKTATSTSVLTSTATHISGNPFSGAKWYVNKVWANQITSSAGATVKTQNTGLWMDRIGALTDGIGLVGHLDDCLAQGANLITLVVYDLPNRDCAASASNGELKFGEMNRYKTEYIDPYVAILANAKYASIRMICIIEPDSLPNLITNLSIAKCSESNSAEGGYVQGVQYALNKLAQIPNVYNYIDIAHSGWLGWSDNFQPSVTLIANAVKGTTKGVNSIDGFISNTANYTPYEETYLPNSDLQVGGTAVKSSAFYAWNPYLDEKDYVTAMYSAYVSAGFPSSIGMLVDTSRNGWGGTSYGRSRPTAASTSTDVNTYVNASRIDRRYHRGNWCNQDAGIGAKPAAAPASNIDAFVWIKPPGESDGVSSAGTVDPNDPAKTFDMMCDPNGMSKYDSNYKTGAMTAPHAGRWNQTQFDVLVKNAYPAL